MERREEKGREEERREEKRRKSEGVCLKRGVRENKNEEENATEILTQKMTLAERRQRMKINDEEGRVFCGIIFEN